MTKPIDVKRNPYTQRQIERAIKAALRCGLKVVAVRPDGTVLTDAASAAEGETSKWADRRPNDDAQKLVDARKKLGVWR